MSLAELDKRLRESLSYLTREQLIEMLIKERDDYGKLLAQNVNLQFQVLGLKLAAEFALN